MKPFSQFLPDLLPLVPSCPEPVAKLALRRAAQRFCELTRAWRVVLDPITVASGIDAYDLPVPEKSELVRIEVAKLDGEHIHVATQDETQRSRDYVFCPDGEQIYLNPLPSSTRSLVLTAALKPADNAPGVEDFVAARYRDLIARGAAARLKQQPGKAYSDPATGMSMWSSFESGCAEVRERVRRGFGRVPSRVVPNFF